MTMTIDFDSRDAAILTDLRRVRLLTGGQLERLHFSGLRNGNTQGSARRRTLSRLSRHGLVTTLPRRVGGVRAGSAGLIYAMDARGQRLLARETRHRVRRPWPVGLRFVEHTLAVSEVYVRLREAERAGHLRLVEFEGEPASWYRTHVGVLRPDAFVLVVAGDWERHVWLEVDLATESLPTIRRKLASYVEAAAAGSDGPQEIFPAVIVTTPAEVRATAIAEVIHSLPPPGDELIRACAFAEATAAIARPPPSH